MNTKEPEPDSGALQPADDDANNSHTEPERRRGGGALTWLALLVAVIALCAAGLAAWQRHLEDRTAADTEARFSELRSAIEGMRENVDAAITQAESNAAEIRSVKSTIGRLETRIGELQSEIGTVRNALAADRAERERLTARLQQLTPGDAVRRLRLLEAEFLISQAYRELALNADARAAVQTLQAADDILAGLDAMQVQPVRRALQQEIQSIQAMPRLDIAGTSARLQALIRRVPELPLKYALAGRNFDDAPGKQAQGDQGWWQATQDFLGRYFTVRRTDQSGTEVPAPETLHLLHEQLQLKLEQARLALLRRAPELYQAALSQSAGWLKRYFEREAQSVKAALEEIQTLQGVPITREAPNLGAALQALESVRAETG